MRVSELLNQGSEHPITGRELCSLLHVDLRNLQAKIQKERKDGYPICASTGATGKRGYFLAKSKDEMVAYCEALRRRAGNIFAIRRACLETVSSINGGDKYGRD